MKFKVVFVPQNKIVLEIKAETLDMAHQIAKVKLKEKLMYICDEKYYRFNLIE